MHTSPYFFNRLNWTLHSIRFFQSHFFLIFGLGLVAALGRATQLGAFGQVSAELNVLLEVVVETARILIFLYALGLTRVRTGLVRITTLLTDSRRHRQNVQVAIQNLRSQWAAFFLNIVVFLLIAGLVNRLIDHIAYQTCLYVKLKAGHIIADQASEWTIILFFKNVSIIPFTLIFNALFWLWLINRLPKPGDSRNVTMN